MLGAFGQDMSERWQLRINITLRQGGQWALADWEMTAKIKPSGSGTLWAATNIRDIIFVLNATLLQFDLRQF